MLRRKVYTTRSEKVIDLIIGAGVYIVVNGLLGAIGWGVTTLTTNLPSSSSADAIRPMLDIALYAAPFVVNIGLMLFFAFWRPWIALGMLATFGALLAIGLCLVAVLGVACLIALGQLNP